MPLKSPPKSFIPAKEGRVAPYGYVPIVRGRRDPVERIIPEQACVTGYLPNIELDILGNE